MRTYQVYVLASRSRRLYVGMTGDLAARLYRHRSGQVPFTARYRIRRLVLVETYPDAASAIRREKQLKGWRRAKKLALVTASNPAWDDLAPE